jgi:hypothetical protein
MAKFKPNIRSKLSNLDSRPGMNKWKQINPKHFLEFLTNGSKKDDSRDLSCLSIWQFQFNLFKKKWAYVLVSEMLWLGKAENKLNCLFHSNNTDSSYPVFISFSLEDQSWARLDVIFEGVD